jgi:hypothetical protein
MLFADAQSRKNLSEHILDPDPPDNLVHCEGRTTQILGDQFRLSRLRLEHRGQSPASRLKPKTMSLKRQHSRLTRRHALFGQIGNDVKKPINPGARFCRYRKIREPSC